MKNLVSKMNLEIQCIHISKNNLQKALHYSINDFILSFTEMT